MLQLLCHLWGDYMLQNHQMARKKTQSTGWALLHALLYTLPFCLVYGVEWRVEWGAPWSGALSGALSGAPHWVALAWIGGTHLLIDRFALAQHIVHWYGHGEPGRLWWRWVGGSEFGPGQYHQVNLRGLEEESVAYRAHRAPEHVSFWLRVLVDNTLHLTINYLALRWAGLGG